MNRVETVTVRTRLNPCSSVTAVFDGRTWLLLLFLYLMLLVSVSRLDPYRALSFAALPLFLMILSYIPVLPILKKLLFLSPFLLLMAAANPLLDRQTGWISGLCILFKSLSALLALLVLDKTLSVERIAAAFGRLGAPRAFITQLLLLHRFLFLLVSEAATLKRARDLRATGKFGKSFKTTGAILGSLFLRSTDRSNRVYLAMQARGFTGAMPDMSCVKPGIPDLLLAFPVCAILLFLRFHP